MKILLRAAIPILLALLSAGCRIDFADDCEPPLVNLQPVREVVPGEWFCFHAEIPARAGKEGKATFTQFPDWLTAAGDSLFGTVPADFSDTAFTVIVSGNPMADTLHVPLLRLPSVVVFGDIQKGHETNKRVVERILEVAPSAVFHVGDMVQDGREQAQWDTFDLINAPLLETGEFYPAIGNHDYASQPFFDNFELPNNEQWYTVDRLQTRFFVLNTSADTKKGSEQYRWLERELADVPDSIRFIVAVFHYPPYSTGQHGPDQFNLRDSFCELFQEYGVNVVFSGHDHDYERSVCNGVYYVVTGGGGAGLYEQTRHDRRSLLWKAVYHFCRLCVTDDRMIVTVYDLDMNVIDRFVLPG